MQLGCIIFGVPRLPTRPCDERPPAMYGHFCLVPRVSVHDRYYCSIPRRLYHHYFREHTTYYRDYNNTDRLSVLVKLGSSSSLRCCFRQRSSGVVRGLLELLSTFVSFHLFYWPTHFHSSLAYSAIFLCHLEKYNYNRHSTTEYNNIAYNCSSNMPTNDNHSKTVIYNYF